MAPLSTIPDAPADEAAPLTAAPQSKTSLKRLVAGAAVASFVLGLMAATAATSAAAPRAPAAFHSHSSHFMLQGDNGKCLTATSLSSKASVKGEYCNGDKTQVWEQHGTGRDYGNPAMFKLAGTDLCLDALGGIKFMDGRHKHYGLYTCDSNSRNQHFMINDWIITLMYDKEFEYLDFNSVCLNNDGGGRLVTDQDVDSCDGWKWIGTAPPPTPAPPTPSPNTYNCPWGYDKQCTRDSDCISPGFNNCQKCHIGGGSTENICGPRIAPAPTPSPAGKGKCNTQLSPKSQGARSCNPKYNEEDFPYYNRECSGNGKCSTCRKSTTSKHFNGHNWSGYCMDPNDE